MRQGFENHVHLLRVLIGGLCIAFCLAGCEMPLLETDITELKFTQIFAPTMVRKDAPTNIELYCFTPSGEYRGADVSAIVDDAKSTIRISGKLIRRVVLLGPPAATMAGYAGPVHTTFTVSRARKYVLVAPRAREAFFPSPDVGENGDPADELRADIEVQ